MPPTAEPPPEEDCKVCKKGKKGSAAFGALLAARGIAVPGVPGAAKPGTPRCQRPAGSASDQPTLA